MKKYLKKSILVFTFLIGISITSHALVCSTVYFECENGNSSAGIASGETYADMFEEWVELGDVICNPDY